MSIFVIDVESDGPVPGIYSMVSIGAVKLDNNLDVTFYGETKPISDIWVPEALAVSKFSREQHLNFEDPLVVFSKFNDWILQNNVGKPTFISDNLAYDWSFTNYYFHVYLKNNPFGWSGRRIGDFYAGLTKNWFGSSDWKKFKITKHTHNPVDDAKGNAEALLKIFKDYNIRMPK